jgi:hemolysin III
MENRTRAYSRAEIVVDGAVHATGIIASLVAVPLLLVNAVPHLDVASSIGLAVYGVAIIALFCISATYHLVPHEHWKPALKRYDQAAIFMKIAGTYTPLVIFIGSLFGFIVLAGVWIAALFGAVAKLWLGERYERVSVAVYLPLGWASLLLAWPIITTLPLSASVLIPVGGVLYSVGTIFHMWERLRFQNAIWHGFVFAASSCHFAAIASSALAAGQ